MKYEVGRYYHFYNRGAHRARVFRHPDNYRYLLRLMKQYAVRYNVIVAAYCLMPNHYHFVLSSHTEGSISKFLQVLFNAFTQGMNRWHSHHGTWFESPVKARELDSRDYLLHAVNYVHLNPVKAGLVARPGGWEFSSYREWIGVCRAGFTDCEVMHQFFADGEEYKEYLEGITSSMLSEYNLGDIDEVSEQL